MPSKQCTCPPVRNVYDPKCPYHGNSYCRQCGADLPEYSDKCAELDRLRIALSAECNRHQETRSELVLVRDERDAAMAVADRWRANCVTRIADLDRLIEQLKKKLERLEGKP